MGKKEDTELSSRGETSKKIFTGIAVLAGLGLLAFLLVKAPDGTQRSEPLSSQPVSDTSSSKPKTPPSDVQDLKELAFYPEEGREHVPDGTQVMYKTNPPTSGRHYAKWLPPGVYEVDKTKPELLVHNLEHGNIVVYFDRSQLAPDAIDALLVLPKNNAGQWDGVVLVDQKGLASPLILTAWRVHMPLKKYDAKKVERFLDAFRGRGPENPVR